MVHEEEAAQRRKQAAAAKQADALARTVITSDHSDQNAEPSIPSATASDEQLPPPAPEPEPLPLLTHTGRLRRNYRLPARYRDDLPPCPIPLPPIAPGSSALPQVIHHIQDVFKTISNSYGLSREYPYRPTYDPESAIPNDHLSTYYAKFQPEPTTELSAPVNHAPFWPFKNMTSWLMMHWANTGSQSKSEAEMDRLAQTVFSHPEFNVADAANFSARREGAALDKSDDQNAGAAPFLADGWMESHIDISVPLGTKDSRGHSAPFRVPGLQHRSLLSIMKAALVDESARRFHFSPFKRFWKPLDGPERRVYDEAYTSDAWLEEHDKLQKQPNEPDCKLEKVVLGLMFWSDSTHLTNFGTAKLWPLYLYFGNLSKYFRGKPGSGASHHVAYIPSLPDSIQDFLGPGSRKPAVLTHCRRELMHKVLDKVLDDDFVHAYRHGFAMECLDGVWRRFYPRIFTYSADYPEKALLASIRCNGRCPCPRCLVEKSEIHKLGQVKDRQTRSKLRSFIGSSILKARDFIYKTGHIINSTFVEALLFAQSWAPTMNAFVEKLSPFSFDPHQMLVVDLMHEIELGVWKSVFTHLIRILHAEAPGGRLVSELDRRYRLIPTFGHSTIRKFTANASEMKKLAAHNYEDLLQCAIPAFDGLLPEPHNKIVLSLLFRLGEWHALAKLRMHTDSTLDRLDTATTVLGQELRRFSRITCAAYQTKELPKEVAARVRREARTKVKSSSSSSTATSSVPELCKNAAPALSASSPSTEVQGTSGPEPPTTPPSTLKPSGARKGTSKKCFNIWTYKVHALGDYVKTIRMFGTTDSYSTQTGELEHRRVKRLYGRTNKRNAVRQIARRERRETRLLRAHRAAKAKLEHPHHVSFSEDDTLPPTHPAMHHHISDSMRHYQDAFSFGKMYPGDPASKDFVPRLKDHLLGRLLGHQYNGDEQMFSSTERGTIRISDNKIYSAKVFRVNFTTYDLQRDQDTLNPRTHCDVMVMSPETEEGAHPYWYARVLGVFHVKFLHVGPASKSSSEQHMEVLWVRWFGVVPGHRYGFETGRLPKIGFVPEDMPAPFGFLDPSLVIRGCHLIPAFEDLRTSSLLSVSPSAGRPVYDTDDWAAFYVNWFVDRDMFMRYVGGGIGHMHQNRMVTQQDTMDMDNDTNTVDDNAHMAMDVDEEDEGEEDAGLYQSDEEDEESGEEDGDDEDHFSAELDAVMDCDRDYL
ncbi:hypothetical protein HWV62_11479 [Athelia sp. TMB]|nr:hypothetical protein HWV62_11479 [Athelia sp. TMB]